jgi:hypothetical protein
VAPACTGSEPGGVSSPEPQGGSTLGVGGAASAGTSLGGGSNDSAGAGAASVADGTANGGSNAEAAGAAGVGGGSGGASGSSGFAGSAGAGGAGAAGAANGPIAHRFVSGISDGGPVALVAADGHIEWQYDVSGEANDAWQLPNGDIVFAYKTGARELTPEKQVVWSYDAPAGSEIHSCQPLPNGFLIGEAHDGGVGYLRELDGAGKVQKTVTIHVAGGLGAHSQFREVRKTPQGTYLVTYLDLGKAHEVDQGGNVLREFPCGSFVAIRLKDGNTLVSCGDDHRVIEVDPQGSVVWEVKQKEIPGNQLGFAAGLQRLANGNTIICNWPGHGGVPAGQPQAFELTREKRVVWQLSNPALELVSNLEVLDPSGAIDGVVYR